jgi:DnaK suppressor protein
MQYHAPYQPTDEEEYMNPKQLDFFKALLLDMRRDLMSATDHAKNDLKEALLNTPDIFDVASKNAELALDIEDLERTRRSLEQIDKALSRINSGEYGFCDLTGEEIGIRRLQAQPVATLCIEVQEMLERNNQMAGQQRQSPAL